MGEKRKPTFIFLLKKPGKKTMKLEIFPKNLWGGRHGRYRLRANGKWFHKDEDFGKYEIRDILWRSIKGSFDR